MVLNIHGLYGNQYNTNYKELIKRYSESEIISPQIDFVGTSPFEVLDSLKVISDVDFVVGNSFGGFFAYLLSCIYDVDCILINPCIPPAKYIPNLVVDYPAAYSNELKNLFDNYFGHTSKYHLILGENDDVISSVCTRQLFSKNTTVINGGHRLSGTEFSTIFQKVVIEIEDFKNIK